MVAYLPQPVLGVKSIGLLAVNQGMPVETFPALLVLSDDVSLFPSAGAQPQSSQGAARGASFRKQIHGGFAFEQPGHKTSGFGISPGAQERHGFAQSHLDGLRYYIA